MPKFTSSTKKEKIGKPYPDFPLWIHPSGRWCKKVKSRFHYFGYVSDDPLGNLALEQWLADKDDLLAGRIPRKKDDGSLTVTDLCNNYLEYKEQILQSGEIATRTFDRYCDNCSIVIKFFGGDRAVTDLRPIDFQGLRAAFAKRLGHVAVSNEIQMVRSLFKYGYEAELFDTAIRFGPGFKKPSAKTLRTARSAGGPKMFSREDILSILDSATINFKAMALLAINGGLGNSDLALLPITSINMKTGWLNYPRPKTGMNRRIPLWTETMTAIKDVISNRKTPIDKDDEKLLFIGKTGKNYIGKNKGYRVTAEYSRCAKKAGVEDRTFYDFRRTFQTIAEGANDLVAVQSIMGHAAASGDMSAVYRQGIDDKRLKAVTEHVRNWLFKQ